MPLAAGEDIAMAIVAHLIIMTLKLPVGANL